MEDADSLGVSVEKCGSPGKEDLSVFERMNLKALSFFAGSGLVDAGLQPEFQTVWANDVSSRKASVFRANHPQRLFSEADIRTIDGRDLPVADLAWASFPCQDLSLAGERNGMADGTRSGLFWEWLRV